MIENIMHIYDIDKEVYTEICTEQYFKENYQYTEYRRENKTHYAIFTDKTGEHDKIEIGHNNIQDFRILINFYCRYIGQAEPFINPSTDGRRAEASNEQ